MENKLFKGAGVALITPMNEDKSVNYNKLKELVNWQIENKTDAIIACGTTGESSTLTDEEKLKVIEEVVKETKKRIPVIAGTGSNNTMHAVELSKKAEKLNVDGLLVVTPYYNKTSQEGLVKHYETIASSVNIPVIVYDVPSRTGCKIEPKTFEMLEKIKNIEAVKAASGSISDVTTISANCKNLKIYSGNDDQITSMMAIGGIGVISVLSNIMPKQTHEICEFFLEGKVKESKELQLKLLDLIHAIFIDVNPIPVKEAMNLMGLNVGPCRLPLYKLNEKKLEILKSCLKKHNLI